MLEMLKVNFIQFNIPDQADNQMIHFFYVPNFKSVAQVLDKISQSQS